MGNRTSYRLTARDVCSGEQVSLPIAPEEFVDDSEYVYDYDFVDSWMYLEEDANGVTYAESAEAVSGWSHHSAMEDLSSDHPELEFRLDVNPSWGDRYSLLWGGGVLFESSR